MNDITESEVLNMVNDTSNIVKKEKIAMFSSIAGACKQTNNLTNSVEFWKWMGANYNNNFGTNELIELNANINSDWILKQLQGKGYEWDFMTKQRSLIKNIFSRFVAGDSPTQPGIDINKVNIFNKSAQGNFQNKAYVNKNNPILHNTPKDSIVVTNKEKTVYAKRKGYNTEKFMDADKIKKARNKRFNKAKNGTASKSYNFKNVNNAMAKAGTMGCIIGITTETIASYRKWKNGIISDKEYIKEIAKAGGDAGITAGTTSGIMVPISAGITAAGASTVITIPIGFLVGGAVNKVVAPCFARGKYREILNNARYYQNLEGIYCDLLASIESSAQEYEDYINSIKSQKTINKKLEERSMELNEKLKDLYDSI
ncbi:hypothetical protein [Clostridium sp. DL1XJH146]